MRNYLVVYQRSYLLSPHSLSFFSTLNILVRPAMAEHATRHTTSDRLEEAIITLAAKHSELASRVDAMCERFSSVPPHQHPSSSSRMHQRPPVKLDVPRFDGHDPLGWIFKISQFFDYQATPEEDRITVASFYLDGAALSWFQWMYRNGFITTWQALLHAIETRLAPSIYDDPRGALFKLVQRGSVTEYMTEFERLANRIVGLSLSDLLSCFISGLNPEIRREVQAFQPVSLPHATSLARLQEDKINDRRKNSRSHQSVPQTTPSQPFSLPQHPRPKNPFIQRTPEEMMHRREKGLCYNCDEKWSSSHRCKGRVLLFIADSDEPLLPNTKLDDTLPQPLTETAPAYDPTPFQTHISLHAMAGVPATDTFRLYGVINHARVTILIDSESTHNFIQPRVAKFLGLAMEETTTLRVMLIQSHPFTVTLRVLPLSGADVVLGVEWLRTLGPIITDYTAFTMAFTYMGQPITLHADVSSDTNPTSAYQLKRSLHTHSISGLFHLSLLPVTQPDLDSEPPHPISAINTLLLKYQVIFQQPTTLPPPRQHDHHINLIPSALPVNVRPYRYPHSQKNEIEKQVTSLLESGLIQPSRSPFSSPVLLVKKKDGTWRMCVDYRALNAITVKDWFPIPTIEELLDELASAS